jgi:hypothetical protein
MTGDLVYGVRLFVPGTAVTITQWQDSLGGSGLTLDGQLLTSEALGFRAPADWVENDGTFGEAFGHGTMSVEEQRAVARASSALVMDLPVYLGAAAGEVAVLITALGDAGALGVRLEQSKLGRPVTRWIRALSGDTFTSDSDTPRRRLERWPDDGYPPGHACHKPFGAWRLGAEGGEADSRGELRPVFIPPLAALLAAAEEKAGRRLRRGEVKRLTRKGACMMMTHADAKNLERGRGYADLEPELAWRQWQIVRESRT